MATNIQNQIQKDSTIYFPDATTANHQPIEVRRLDGEVVLEFCGHVNHFVGNNACGNEYKNAVNLGKMTMKESFDITNEALMEDHKMKSFTGLNQCFLGLVEDKKENENGCN